MPSEQFLRALATLRDPSGYTGRLYVDLAEGCPKSVSVPVKPTVLVLPDRRQLEAERKI